MKRTLCIILMLPLLFAAMGQTLDVRDIVVDTENDGTLKYDYYYSPDGQLSTEQESQLVGGEYIPRRRVVRNYISGTNNSLCESHEDFVNGEWILSDMVTLSYQQDRLSKAVQTFADGETREYSMSYDRKGRIVMQTLTTTKNSETSTISQSWFYSANGNLGYISFAVTYADGSKQSYRLRIVTNDTDKTVLNQAISDKPESNLPSSSQPNSAKSVSKQTDSN